MLFWVEYQKPYPIYSEDDIWLDIHIIYIFLYVWNIIEWDDKLQTNKQKNIYPQNGNGFCSDLLQ